MTKLTSITLSAGIAKSLFPAPAIADDLDDTVRIIGQIFTAHHRTRVLLCDYDDGDVGTSVTTNPTTRQRRRPSTNSRAFFDRLNCVSSFRANCVLAAAGMDTQPAFHRPEREVDWAESMRLVAPIPSRPPSGPARDR